MNASNNPTLIITPTENANVIITKITTTTQKENNPPIQIKVIEDVILTTGENITLNLTEYFTDTDQENLLFETNTLQNTQVQITNGMLTITALVAGEEQAYVYATDASEITTSNEFTIKILATTRLEDNSTENSTTIENNTAINNTIENNQTNTTENTTIENNTINIIDECNLPINERPNICFEGNESKYFKDIIATLENKDGVTVGRFNRFGNFIIKGLLIEESNENEKERDFKIIYRQNNDFEETITTTAWIDSQTGNLYLKGKLYEENADMQAPQFNTYTIRNKAGIVLAYFDQITGDLYLRGNLVQLGKVTG
jgi:hypothetical protein